MPDKLGGYIKVYRKGETLPTKLDVKGIVDTLNGLYSGSQHGMPKVTPEFIGDKMLLEGRADAGTNEYNTNNPRAKALFDAIATDYNGAPPQGATTAAAILDKQEVAKRLNIPFELAWNGTGKKGEADGQRHAARAEVMQGAINDPRNAEFKDLLTRGLQGNLTAAEQASQINWVSYIGNLTGAQEITRDNTYTKDAIDGMSGVISKTVQDLKLPQQRAAAVLEDLKSPAEVMNVLPTMLRSSLGYEGPGAASTLKPLAKYGPDTMDVLNKIIGNYGKTPDAASQTPADSGKSKDSAGIIDKILSFL